MIRRWRRRRMLVLWKNHFSRLRNYLVLIFFFLGTSLVLIFFVWEISGNKLCYIYTISYKYVRIYELIHTVPSESPVKENLAPAATPMTVANGLSAQVKSRWSFSSSKRSFGILAFIISFFFFPFPFSLINLIDHKEQLFPSDDLIVISLLLTSLD